MKDDHGFSKVCPGGNIMAHLYPNPPIAQYEDDNLEGFCKECGRPLNNANDELCSECKEFFVNE